MYHSFVDSDSDRESLLSTFSDEDDRSDSEHGGRRRRRKRRSLVDSLEYNWDKWIRDRKLPASNYFKLLHDVQPNAQDESKVCFSLDTEQYTMDESFALHPSKQTNARFLVQKIKFDMKRTPNRSANHTFRSIRKALKMNVFIHHIREFTLTWDPDSAIDSKNTSVRNQPRGITNWEIEKLRTLLKRMRRLRKVKILLKTYDYDADWSEALLAWEKKVNALFRVVQQLQCKAKLREINLSLTLLGKHGKKKVMALKCAEKESTRKQSNSVRT